MSLIISLGRYGGFYFSNGFSKRLCLGWLAITVLPKDVDELFGHLLDEEGEGTV